MKTSFALLAIVLLPLLGCGSAGTSIQDDATEDTAAKSCTFWSDCEDGNPCTSHDCIEGKCVTKVRVGRSCDDENVCTVDDQCREDGTCLGDSEGACIPQSQCVIATCDPEVGCIYTDADETVECSDDNGCTLDDYCSQGECISGEPAQCQDEVPTDCLIPRCEPSTGECVDDYELEGTACDDNNPCTLDDLCDAKGICYAPTIKECTTTLTCKRAWCNEQAASEQDACVVDWLEAGSKCDDLDVCTMLDTCVEAGQEMACVGEPVECTTPNPCQAGTCVQGTGCVWENINEGLPCLDKPRHFCVEGECYCEPICDGLQCGPDSCGAVCGTCGQDSACFKGECLEPGLQCVDGNDEPWDGCFDGQITEFRVEPDTLTGGRSPEIVAMPDGSYFVIWRTADGAAVYMRRFTSEGTPQGEPLQVNNSLKGFIERPRAALLQNGGIAVVWSDMNGERNRVYARVLGPNASWEGGQFEASSGTGHQQQGAVAATTDGNFVVVWSRVVPLSSDTEVRMRRFVPQGNPISDAVVLDTFSSSGFRPRVAGLAGGGFVVVWEQVLSMGGGAMPEGPYTSAYGRVFDWNASPVGETFNGWNGKVFGSAYPVAVTFENGFTLFWNASPYDAFGNMSIQGRSFNWEGVASAGFFFASNNDDTSCKRSSVAVGSSVAMVAWDEGEDLVARLFSLPSWATQGQPFLVPTISDGIQEEPSVARLASGDFIVAWSGELPEAAGRAIFAQRFTSDGIRQYR